MIVLSYGLTKSGSTLAFELCKSVLVQRRYDQRRLPDAVVTPGQKVNFIGDVSVDRLQRLMSEVHPSEIIAIKLHTAAGPNELSFIEDAIQSGKMKLHVNVRDPREIALSLVDAGKRARTEKRSAFSEIESLEDATKAVGRQLVVCRKWGAVKGALHLFYNEVAFDTPSAAQRICADFGFDPLHESEVQTVIGRAFGSFTQKNKAVKDRYKDDLTVRQNEFLIDNIKGAKGFIRRVVEKQDMGWFQPQTQTNDLAEI